MGIKNRHVKDKNYNVCENCKKKLNINKKNYGKFLIEFKTVKQHEKGQLLLQLLMLRQLITRRDETRVVKERHCLNGAQNSLQIDCFRFGSPFFYF